MRSWRLAERAGRDQLAFDTWSALQREFGPSLAYATPIDSTDAAMFAELDSAYQRKAPIMLWIYAPHWAPAKYKGEWVQFPEWTPECYSDPAWGSNPDKAYDCGKPHGEIYKYSWKGFAEKWPLAHKIAKNMKFSDDEMNTLIGQVDLDKKSLDEVADAWIAANQDKIKQWAQ